MKIGDTTPWGIAQWVTKLADGIWSVSTSSHGGIVLDQPHIDRIPPSIKPFTNMGDRRYWEEDFDCYVPVLFFQTEIEANGALIGFPFKEAEEILKKERPRWHTALLIQALKETPKQKKRSKK